MVIYELRLEAGCPNPDFDKKSGNTQIIHTNELSK